MSRFFYLLLMLLLSSAIRADPDPIREQQVEIDFGDKQEITYTFEQQPGEFTVILYQTQGTESSLELVPATQTAQNTDAIGNLNLRLLLKSNECLTCPIKITTKTNTTTNNTFLLSLSTYSESTNKERLKAETLYKSILHTPSNELAELTTEIDARFQELGREKDIIRGCEALTFAPGTGAEGLLKKLADCAKFADSPKWLIEHYIFKLNYATELTIREQYQESQLIRKEIIEELRAHLKSESKNNALHYFLALSLYTLAQQEIKLGNYHYAELFINEARQYFQLIGNNQKAAITYLLLGYYFRVQNKFSLAEEQLKLALKYYNSSLTPSPNYIATILTNLAIVRASTGRYDEALEILDSALEYNADGQDEAIAHILSAKARIYKELGRTNESIGLYNSAWSLYENIGANSNLTTISNHLIDIYTNQGDVEKARYYLNEAIKYGSQGWGLDHSLRLKQAQVNHYLSLGDTTTALEELTLLEQLLAGSDNHFRAGRVLSQKAEALIQIEDYQSALDSANQAIQHHKLANDNLYQVRSNYLLGLASYKLNKPIEEILTHLNRSINNIESIRQNLNLSTIRQDYFALQKNIYETAIEAHLATNKANREQQSFYTAESFRARTLYESLFTKLNNPKNRESNILNLASTQEETKLPKLSEQEFKQYLKLIDKNEAIAYFFLGNSTSYLWFATKDNLKVIELPNATKLSDSLTNTINSISKSPITSNPTTSWQTTYQNLRLTSETLLAPIKDQLKNINKLTIIPDGALHRIPFATLLSPNDNYKSPLTKSIQIRYASSVATDLKLNQGLPKSKNHKMLMIANPAINQNSNIKNSTPNNLKGNLFSAEKEAEYIASLWKMNGSVKLLENNSANKPNLLNTLKDDYDIIHLATHAVVDWDNPQQSAIKLASIRAEKSPFIDNPDLTLSEISNLTLNSELIVLSACETAVGKHVIGEGPIGLSRAFFETGSRRVLASLWPVDDEATARLLEYFYEGIVVGKTPSEALQRAQINMLNTTEYFHPYFWAGFIFIGKQSNWLTN